MYRLYLRYPLCPIKSYPSPEETDRVCHSDTLNLSQTIHFHSETASVPTTYSVDGATVFYTTPRHLDEVSNPSTTFLCVQKPPGPIAAWRSSRLVKMGLGLPLMVQCLRICCPMQGTCVWPLVSELRSHMPWGNWAPAPQLETLCTTHYRAPVLQCKILHATTKPRSRQ